MSDQIQKIYDRLLHKENICMWGHLYVSKTGQTGGGWLINSWSEHGAPYWQAEMHWLEKTDNKLYHVYLNMAWGGGAIQILGEDKDIDPERAKFIRQTVEQWETEWFQEEANKTR